MFNNMVDVFVCIWGALNNIILLKEDGHMLIPQVISSQKILVRLKGTCVSQYQ